MATSLRTEYEQRLVNEIKELPESEIPKILKLIHFLKEEILGTKNQKEEDLQLFWQSFGSWKDERPTEEIIREIYEGRRSTTREVKL